jgi:hypothetical protein
MIPNEISWTCRSSIVASVTRNPPHTHILRTKKARTTNLSKSLCRGGLEYKCCLFDAGECNIRATLTEKKVHMGLLYVSGRATLKRLDRAMKNVASQLI